MTGYDRDNTNLNYEDIINLPHPVSKRHKPMPVEDRAAQFAPFAALTGHQAAIEEAARVTDIRMELDEEMKEQLNVKLQKIVSEPGQNYAGERRLRAEARRMVRQGAQDQRAVCPRGQRFAGCLRAAHPQHQHFHPPAGPRAVLRARSAPRRAAHRLERRPCGGQRPLYLRVLPWRSRYISTRC